jgi:hypothetical protein
VVASGLFLLWRENNARRRAIAQASTTQASTTQASTTQAKRD